MNNQLNFRLGHNIVQLQHRSAIRHASVHAGIARGIRLAKARRIDAEGPAARRTSWERRSTRTGEPDANRGPRSHGAASLRSQSRQPSLRDGVRSVRATDAPRTASLHQSRSRSNNDQNGANVTQNSFRHRQTSPLRHGQDTLPGTHEGSFAIRDDIYIPTSIKYTTSASTFVPGARAVLAALNGGRRKEFYRAYVTDGGDSNPRIVRLLQELKVPITNIDGSEMTKMLHALGMAYAVSDGVLLECSDIPRMPVHSLDDFDPERGHIAFETMPQSKEDERINGIEDSVDRRKAARPYPLILWLHGVVDTGNIAGLYRSALYYGVDAMALSTRATGGVPRNKNSGNVRAAAGAAEYIPTLSVPDPDSFIFKSQKRGWRFIATGAPSAGGKHADISEHQAMLAAYPCVLVLGNEDEGLPRRFIKKMDAKAVISESSGLARQADIDSLNVGVAGGVLLDRLVGRAVPVSEAVKSGQNAVSDASSVQHTDAKVRLW